MSAPLLSATASAAPSFDFTVRVYYEDTDAGGVVYYANYLRFFERARTEWLRALGVSQQRLAATHALQFVVASAAIDYHRAARLDNLVTIRSRLGKIGRVALTFAQEAWLASPDTTGPDGGSAEPTAVAPTVLLATATVRVGCVRVADLAPAAIPADLRRALIGPAV